MGYGGNAYSFARDAMISLNKPFTHYIFRRSLSVWLLGLIVQCFGKSRSREKGKLVSRKSPIECCEEVSSPVGSFRVLHHQESS